MDPRARQARLTRRPRALVPVALLSALGLHAAALWAGPALAQPTDGELRRRLAAVETSRPEGVPRGSVHSVRYLVETASRIEGSFRPQAASWRARADSFLSAIEAGRDPYVDQRGKLVNRGYASELSSTTQGYAIYLPPDYDAARRWPLIVVLHGGSSNGNLFLGVVLGNNMSWLHYDRYLWDDFEARWSPEAIVVAPDGFGQVMWRWMGEQDVLDVIADVERHYAVDPDRIVLAGLSNGGVGAYSIGTRHASRFSVVQAIAGAPSWLQYAGSTPLPVEATAMRMFSGLHLIENTTATDFRVYHGRTDTGPMKPRFVSELERHMEGLGLPRNVTWYDAGHDILYRVHRHGRTFDALGAVVRDRRPSEVRVVTGDFRAARQHWLEVTRIERYPELSRTVARVEGGTLSVDTDRARAFAIDLRDAPLTGTDARIVVNGAQVYSGPRAHLGHVVHVRRDASGFRLGFVDPPTGSLEKRPGLSGPLTDAYYGRVVHVYGTGDPAQTAELRRAAERGARGLPMWLWRFQQEVVADTAVTDELARSGHLMLYGTAGTNAVLERVRDQLPIRIERDAVVMGAQRFTGPDVGVRFIYPSPLAEDRYVVVQAGVTARAVAAGNNLPDFLPDYLVYGRETTRSRPRLATGPNRPLAIGYFDDAWRLPAAAAPGHGGDGRGADAPGAAALAPGEGGQEGPPDPGVAPLLPVPLAPAVPPPPRRFGAPPSDPAGAVARRIARLVTSFENFRALIPGANWRVDERARWSVQAQESCHRALRDAGVPFRPLGEHPTPVPSPVELLGPVDGTWFRITHEDRPLAISCELARRLPALVALLRTHGIRGVEVMSAYREHPRASFHTMGLALDISRLWTDEGWLSVQDDYQETPARETCAGAAPRDGEARRLREIACALHRSRAWSSVLTPNYNDGHRDHFHIDARPDDPRLFLR